MNPVFQRTNRGFRQSVRIPGLIVIGAAAWLVWNAAKPSTPAHAGKSNQAAPTLSQPAVNPTAMETLPEPVRQLMAAANAETRTLPQWKGASSLPEDEQQSLWRAFSLARHEIHPLTDHQKSLEENNGALYLASNPGQGLRARFLQNGLKLLPGTPGEEWSGMIGLDSPDGPPAIAQDGTSLQYRHASGVTEWFENRPDGIEHGFIVHEKSPWNTGTTLKVPVRLEGLRAVPFPDRGDLQLVDATGRSVLSYEHLQVWDADGVALAAQMNPVSNGLEIRVNTTGARFPVVIDPLILAQQAHLRPDAQGSGELYDSFSYSVDVYADTALIGAFNDDDNGLNSGSAYVFTRNGTTWSLQQKLLAPNSQPNDRFGTRLSLDGETALIGSMDAYSAMGRAYVFVRNGMEWSVQQVLAAADGAVSDQFGCALDLKGDNALIGAYSDDDISLSTGSAYIFVRNGSIWTQQQKLRAPDATLNDQFGLSVALSGDTALVGAPEDDTGTSLDHGSVYAFQRSGSTWTFQQKLIGNGVTNGDYFGWSLSASGDTALIGAFYHDAGPMMSGAVYVFTRTGSLWTEQQKLLAPDAVEDNAFGRSLMIDGDTAVIAAQGDAGHPYGSSGSAYVFSRETSVWSLQQKLTPPVDMTNGVLGTAVAISGNTILAGSSEDSGNNRGSGFVFVRQNTTWTLQQRLTAGDGATYDTFGISVSLSENTAIVGTELDDDNGVDSGSAYVFVRNGSIWTKQQKLVASDGIKSNYFGKSVGVSGDTAMIGSSNAGPVGKVYVFTRSGTIWTEGQQLIPLDQSARSGFGATLALSGDTALFAASGDSTSGLTRGSAYVYQRNGSAWNFQQKLVASDGEHIDGFGSAISLSGETALIGAVNDDNNGLDSGSAYVFVRNGSLWTEQKILTAPDGAANDSFGVSLSLSGNFALIGASGDDDQGWNSGSAYVFIRQGSDWSLQQKLKAVDGTGGRFFGGSVSLSHASALIGAVGDITNGTSSGSAYLFWRSGPDWSQQQKLLAPDGAANDNFGGAVCISNYTALIAASLDDGFDSLGGYAWDQGSVYVFENTNPDVDGDGLANEHETGTGVFVSAGDTGSDPFIADTDGDDLSDGEEAVIHGSDPNQDDTDGDNYLDSTEVSEGGNPVNAAGKPEMRPQITPAKKLTFFSRNSAVYRVEGSDTGVPGSWAVLVGPIRGTGSTVSAVVTDPPPFLRVVEQF